MFPSEKAQRDLGTGTKYIKEKPVALEKKLYSVCIDIQTVGSLIFVVEQVKLLIWHNFDYNGNLHFVKKKPTWMPLLLVVILQST